MNFLPSLPLALEKNWTVRVVPGLVSSSPRMVVVLPDVTAEVRAGLFCRPFGPVSASSAAPPSLAVTPKVFPENPRVEWTKSSQVFTADGIDASAVKDAKEAVSFNRHCGWGGAPWLCREQAKIQVQSIPYIAMMIQRESF